MKKRRKILFLFEDLCYGGTQKQNLELALRLDRERFQVCLLTLTGPTDLDSACAGLELLHLGTSRKLAPFFFLRLKNAIMKLQPDIVLPCTALPNIWGRIWGRYLRVPLVVGTCRGGGAPVRQHERFLWRLTDHIICNSEASVLAMEKRGIPADHLSFIANGIDTDLFRPGENRAAEPLILSVCRLAKDKDITTLLSAFEIAWRQMPDLRLRIVGEGPEEKSLLDFMAAKISPQCQKNVEFSGASANPLPHYQQASIFALSSVREGQPNVILEAMSCGLPVCATNVGGIPQLVKPGETGLLSPASDPASLAENLLLIARKPDLARNMGQAARKNIRENFSFDRMVNSHERLFDQLWEKRLAKA